MAANGGANTWPMVGRNGVVADLLGQIRDANGFIVAGPAGVGKSRVLSEVSERFEGDSVEIISISGAQSTAAVPLAPLLRIIDPEAEGPLANLVLAELRRRSRSGSSSSPSTTPRTSMRDRPRCCIRSRCQGSRR